MFEDLCEELNVDTFISSNGQYVVVKGEVIYENPINLDLIENLTNLASDNEHPIVYMGVRDMKTNVMQHSHIEESLATLKVKKRANYNPHFYKEYNIFHMILACKDQEESIYEKHFTELKFIRWHPLAVDVLYKMNSKSSAIQRIIQKTKIQENNIYAFGDEINDLEMLKFVQNSVAMGNAPNIVKESAKYVTKDVNDDGILHGLKALNLLS